MMFSGYSRHLSHITFCDRYKHSVIQEISISQFENLITSITESNKQKLKQSSNNKLLMYYIS